MVRAAGGDEATLPARGRTTYADVEIEADPGRPGGRMLYLDGIECSYIDLEDPTHIEFGYIRRFADVIDLAAPPRQPLRVTHLGGGGFTLPAYVAATRPRSQQFVYEYDAGLIEVARRELGLRTGPGMRVKIGDARERLTHRSPGSADVVIGDAFVGRAVPPHLASVEFVRLVASVLADGGIYVLNVIDEPPLRAVRCHVATVRRVFPHLTVSTDPDVLRGKASGNLVIAASAAPLPVDELRRRAGRGSLPERVLDESELTTLAGTALPWHDGGDVDTEPTSRGS